VLQQLSLWAVALQHIYRDNRVLLLLLRGTPLCSQHNPIAVAPILRAHALVVGGQQALKRAHILRLAWPPEAVDTGREGLLQGPKGWQ
jgi:hypothetical protein